MNRGYGSHAVAGGQSHVRTVAGTVGEFSGNGPAAGRVSSTPDTALSYLGLDHTGFGWEVKVHLEILICYLDDDIGILFFSCVACPPVLLILRRAASSFFTTFLSSFVGPSVIRLSRRMADGSSPL